MNKIKDLEKHLNINNDQEVKDILELHPIIHFSKDARSIFMDGFKYGAKKENVDCSFDISKKDDNGDIIRLKESSGINYAFDTLSYSFENDCNDFEYGINNGMGMYDEMAIICLSNAVKTTHKENFDQCLFYGEDVDFKTMILLKNEGDALNEDGEFEENENGEEYEKWSAYSKIEGHLVRAGENLSLEETISQSLRIMIEKNRYPSEIINNYNAMYAESDYSTITLPEGMEKELTLLEANTIANRVRNEMNDEHQINGDFVDYCDLCAEKVEEILIKEGFNCEVKNSFYIHQFEDCEIDTYGHHWVECDGIIIDPSRSQFDSNEYALKKSLNKNYTDDEINKSVKNELTILTNKKLKI